jgi:hypothetical protein
MKKILAVLLLLVSFNVNSQYNVNNSYLATNVASTTMSTNINLRLNLVPTNSYSNNSDSRIGPYIILGGVVFTAAGLLTPSTYVGGSTTVKEPFTRQLRNWIMITGGIMSSVGIVVAISGN